MTKNSVSLLREKLGYTQSVLAEKTGLSIRTIQRIESGDTLPKGHTLNVLAAVLGVDQSELRQNDSSHVLKASESKTKIALINLSALSFLGIPFGNILVPMILWNRNNALPEVDEAGRKIINFQIIWSLCVSLSLIASPFLQKALFPSFPLMLMVGIVAIAVNLVIIGKTAMSIQKDRLSFLNLRLRFL